MIREVQAAVTAYEKLDAMGRRLLRNELGLVSAKGIKPKRRRARKAAEGEAAPVTAPKQTRTRQPKGVPIAAPIPTVIGPETAEAK